MEDDVKQDLINIWASTLELIEEGDYNQLKFLSDHTIHNSSIYSDEFSITAAVIIYALSKIAARGDLDVGKITSIVTKLLQCLATNDEAGYRLAQKGLLEHIALTDNRFNLYVDAVLQQARIKKGWKVYEHGLSVGASADLLGVSQWDLMNYIGNTTLAEHTGLRTDVRSRLDFARHLFSK